MTGIYIHIPFCKQKCNYCDFHFSTNLSNIELVVTFIKKELFIRKNELSDEKVSSIYFGGGTPSILTNMFLDQILKTIYQNYTINEEVEITLEANPDDINPINIKNWHLIGINRLSIGVQSFDESTLKWMNRAHNVQQSIMAIELASQYFKNFSIDIIYGIPTQSTLVFEKNLKYIEQFNINHISAYSLTVEKNTDLAYQILHKKIKPINTDIQVEQYHIFKNFMEKKGYEQYEISNFALPSYKSKHNSMYWAYKKYIGIGPAAHSFDGKNRRWNINNNNLYIQCLKNDLPYFEIEILTPYQRYNEFIMVSFRAKEGIILSKLLNQFDEVFTTHFFDVLKKYSSNNHLIILPDVVYLSESGKLFADAISVDFFYSKN